MTLIFTLKVNRPSLIFTREVKLGGKIESRIAEISLHHVNGKPLLSCMYAGHTRAYPKATVSGRIPWEISEVWSRHGRNARLRCAGACQSQAHGLSPPAVVCGVLKKKKKSSGLWVCFSCCFYWLARAVSLHIVRKRRRHGKGTWKDCLFLLFFFLGGTFLVCVFGFIFLTSSWG